MLTSSIIFLGKLKRKCGFADNLGGLASCLQAQLQNFPSIPCFFHVLEAFLTCSLCLPEINCDEDLV